MVAGTGTANPLKFSAAETLTLPPLHELPGVARVGQQQAFTRTETRYDSPDRALERHGLSVRRITDDAGTRWERSAPWDLPETETRTPSWLETAPGSPGSSGSSGSSGADGPDGRVPAGLLANLQGVLRGRPLEPVESVTRQILRYELQDGSGAVAAWVTDEAVQAGIPHRGTGGLRAGGRSWAADGPDADLVEQIADMFRQAGADPAPEEAEPAGREPPGPKSSMGSLLQSYLGEQFTEILRHEPRVRGGDPDGVHKMRVATRRMRSALASYRLVLAPEPATWLRGELRWLAGVLGAARDAQVMRHRLKDLVAAEPEDLVMGPIAARIDEELLDDYRKAYGRIREVLESDRYFLALDRLEALVSAPAWTGTAEDPAGPAAAGMIRRDRKRLHRRVRRTRQLSGSEYAEALHDARKDAKRLRYAAEVWAMVQPAKAGTVVDAAERVQKILGEYQDSVVTRGYLRRMGASASAAGENGFTYGRLHALEQANAQKAQEKFLAAWRDFPPAP